MMSKYLVVAEGTAASDTLAAALTEIAQWDREAAFTLLVPATPHPGLLTWTEGEAAAAAREAANRGRARLSGAGLRVDAAIVGDGSPVQAIADHLEHGTAYDAAVIATPPQRTARWLRMDTPSRARRRFDMPLITVIAERGVDSSHTLNAVRRAGQATPSGA
jgi:hypothetical protein